MSTMIYHLLMGPHLSVIGGSPEIRREGEVDAVLPLTELPPMAVNVIDTTAINAVVATVIIDDDETIDGALTATGHAFTLTPALPWLGTRTNATDPRQIELIRTGALPSVGTAGSTILKITIDGTEYERQVDWNIITIPSVSGHTPHLSMALACAMD